MLRLKFTDGRIVEYASDRDPTIPAALAAGAVRVDGVMADGERLTVPMMLADGLDDVQRAIAKDAADREQARRDMATADSLAAAAEAARDRMIHDLNAWRNPTSDDATVADAASCEAARQRGIHDLNSWRTEGEGNR